MESEEKTKMRLCTTRIYIYIYLTGWLASHYILASYEQWSDGDLLPPKRFPAADALVRFPERP